MNDSITKTFRIELDDTTYEKIRAESHKRHIPINFYIKTKLFDNTEDLILFHSHIDGSKAGYDDAVAKIEDAELKSFFENFRKKLWSNPSLIIPIIYDNESTGEPQ